MKRKISTTFSSSDSLGAGFCRWVKRIDRIHHRKGGRRNRGRVYHQGSEDFRWRDSRLGRLYWRLPRCQASQTLTRVKVVLRVPGSCGTFEQSLLQTGVLRARATQDTVSKTTIMCAKFRGSARPMGTAQPTTLQAS